MEATRIIKIPFLLSLRHPDVRVGSGIPVICQKHSLECMSVSTNHNVCLKSLSVEFLLELVAVALVGMLKQGLTL